MIDIFNGQNRQILTERVFLCLYLVTVALGYILTKRLEKVNVFSVVMPTVIDQNVKRDFGLPESNL